MSKSKDDDNIKNEKILNISDMSLGEIARKIEKGEITGKSQEDEEMKGKTDNVKNMSIREIAKQVSEGNNIEVKNEIDEQDAKEIRVKLAKKRLAEYQARKKWGGILFSAIFCFGIVILVLVVGRSLYNKVGKMLDVQEEIEKEVSTQPSYKFMLAEDLFREYVANKVAADERYKDKILVLQGVVKDIDKDLSGEIYVELIGAEYNLDNVRCYFSNTHKYEVAQLIKGQKVMIKGKCYGSPVGDVVLKGCIFL